MSGRGQRKGEPGIARAPKGGGRPDAAAWSHLMRSDDEPARPVRVVHFMGTSFARSTACGRFVSDSSTLATSADPSDVTCKRCRKAL